MTNSPRALRHYQTAIRALSNGSYGGLSDRERDDLIRVLRTEKHRLLRTVCAADADRDRRCAPRARPDD
jgi:hypothetical protein